MVRPPTPFHRAIDVARAPLVRALEEHVLLEVGEAELIRLLVAHADADVEVHGHDVGGAVVLDDEPEPVGQHLADGLLQLAGGGRRGRRRGVAAIAGGGALRGGRAAGEGALAHAGRQSAPR